MTSPRLARLARLTCLLSLLLVPSTLVSAAPRRPLPRVRPPAEPLSQDTPLERRVRHVATVGTRMDQAGNPGAGTAILRAELGRTPSARFRLMLLDLLVSRPGPEADALLTRVLAEDPNAAVRQRAATMLGFQGSPACAPALQEAAANDPRTRHIGGCKNVDQSARPAAREALRKLRERHGEAVDEALESAPPPAACRAGSATTRPRPRPEAPRGWMQPAP